MIDSAFSLFYAFFIAACGGLGVVYLKVKSTEGIVITTKDFKDFQSKFLNGFSLMLIGELIASASFFATIFSLNFTFAQITSLFLATVVSSTFFSMVDEIFDIGARKDKCVLSSILYSIAMFIMISGGQYEMLLFSRIVFGAASAFHHSSMDSYAHQQHTSLGFPDEWFSQTLQLITHSMSASTAVSGAIGQFALSIGGDLGCATTCLILFSSVGFYIYFNWSRDTSSTTRFVWTGFVYNLTQTLQAARGSRPIVLLLLLSSLCEGSIMVLSFYWAPWMFQLQEKTNSTVAIPFPIMYASFIAASLVGNYLHTLYASQIGLDTTAQVVFIGSMFIFIAATVVQSSSFAFVSCLCLHFLMGGYWPTIGQLRGRLISSEHRSGSMLLSRVGSTLVTVVVLHFTNTITGVLLSSGILFSLAAAVFTNIPPPVDAPFDDDGDY